MTTVSGIICNQCGNELPPHSMERHLDVNDVIHQCPHSIPEMSLQIEKIIYSFHSLDFIFWFIFKDTNTRQFSIIVRDEEQELKKLIIKKFVMSKLDNDKWVEYGINTPHYSKAMSAMWRIARLRLLQLFPTKEKLHEHFCERIELASAHQSEGEYLNVCNAFQHLKEDITHMYEVDDLITKCYIKNNQIHMVSD